MAPACAREWMTLLRLESDISTDVAGESWLIGWSEMCLDVIDFAAALCERASGDSPELAVTLYLSFAEQGLKCLICG